MKRTKIQMGPPEHHVHGRCVDDKIHFKCGQCDYMATYDLTEKEESAFKVILSGDPNVRHSGGTEGLSMKVHLNGNKN